MRPIKAPEEAPAEIHDLQLRCVDAEPGERPSMREVCDVLQRLLKEQQQQAKRGQQGVSRSPSRVGLDEAAARQQLPSLSPLQPPAVFLSGEWQQLEVRSATNFKAYA